MREQYKLEIRNEWPPNIDLIRLALPVPEHATFCYGKYLYNPSGKKVPEEIIYHESIHERQQGNDIDGWWARYLTDKDFRFNQELEAYREQYQLLKKAGMRGKILEYALDSMAEALSGEAYGSLLSFGSARCKIRK